MGGGAILIELCTASDSSGSWMLWLLRFKPKLFMQRASVSNRGIKYGGGRERRGIIRAVRVGGVESLR